MQTTQTLPLNYEGNEVRVVIGEDGETWWVASDVCRILDYPYKNTTHIVNRLTEEDERGRRLTTTPGGQQEVVTINEFGLYRLVMGSRKPEAKSFQRWVYHEVLPTIRKTGSYSITGAGTTDAAIFAGHLASMEERINARIDKVLGSITDILQKIYQKAAHTLQAIDWITSWGDPDGDVSRFVSERCYMDALQWEDKASLFDAYVSFCEEAGYKHRPYDGFFKTLYNLSRFGTAKPKNKQIDKKTIKIVMGIGLKTKNTNQE